MVRLTRRVRWSASASRQRSGLLPVQPPPEILVADHPVTLPDHCFFWIGARQEGTPQLLAPLLIDGELSVIRVRTDQVVRLTQGIKATTRPAILPGVFDHQDLDGIALDVPATTKQVRFGVNGGTLETALE